MLPDHSQRAALHYYPLRTAHTDERHHEASLRELHSVTAALLDCNKINTILLQTPH